MAMHIQACKSSARSGHMQGLHHKTYRHASGTFPILGTMPSTADRVRADKSMTWIIDMWCSRIRAATSMNRLG